jgi:hypothetical protein
LRTKELKLKIICFILLFFISACDSDRASKNVLDKDTIHSEFLSPTESFDIKATHLNKNLKVHDIEEIGKFLVKNSHILKLPAKDEFETTEKYKKRIENIDPKEELFNTKNKQHYLAFPFDRYDTFKYNADKNELEIKVGVTDYSLQKKIILNTKKSTATNAFGVSVDVKYTDEVEYSLELYHPKSTRKSFNRLKNLLYEDNFPYLAITPDWVFYDPINKITTQSDLKFTRSLNLSIEKAKTIKSNSKILIITTLQSPYLIQTEGVVKPRIDIPYAGNRLKNEIIAQIEQIWLYDSYTGDIIEKWPNENDKSK